MKLETEVQLTSKVVSALKLMFVADSLSMPTHWFYRIADIYSFYPNGITTLENAPSHHPGSIMSLHSVEGGGRKKNSHTSKSSQIVGDVILKGKEIYWESTKHPLSPRNAGWRKYT